MRTTIEIPDDLFRALKIRAIKEGVRLKELVARYVAEGLSNSEADIAHPFQKFAIGVSCPLRVLRLAK